MSRLCVGLIAIAMAVAVGAGAACSSFRGEEDPSDASTPEGSTDAGLDAPARNDGGAQECEAFDAAPLLTERYVVCAGSRAQNDLFVDPLNCGACGHSCGGAGCDGKGKCLPEALFDHQMFAFLDATDGVSIFFWDVANKVYKADFVNLGTQSQIGVVPDGATTHLLRQLALGDRLYAREYSMLAYVDPGSQNMPDLAGIGRDGRIAALDTGVIVTEQLTVSDGRVRVFSRDGAQITQYANQPGAHDLAVTKGFERSFWIARGVDADADAGPPIAPTLSERAFGQLISFGAVTLDRAAPNALIADDTTLYLAKPGAEIAAQPVTATTSSFLTLAAGERDRRTQAMATADGRVYWFSSNEPPDYHHADLYSVSRCGGPVTQHLIASDDTVFVNGMIVTADYIYWTSGSRLMRVAR